MNADAALTLIWGEFAGPYVGRSACFHTQLALTLINTDRNFIKSPFDTAPELQRPTAIDTAAEEEHSLFC